MAWFVRAALSALPPDLDRLASDWQPVSPLAIETAARSRCRALVQSLLLCDSRKQAGKPYGTPTVAQPWGNLLVSYSNVLGFNSLELPPFSSGWNAPIDAAALFVDGAAVNSSTWRWTPYSVLRRTAVADRPNVATELRMVYESQVRPP